jgi:hypothetical protein
MSDGTRGEVPKTGSSLTDLKLSNPESVAKISIYYKDGKDYPFGYKFYNKAGDELLSMGTCDGKSKDTILEEGERVVGMKSRLYSNSDPYHCDVQFVIGWLE